VDPVSLKECLKARVAGFKVPKQFIVVDELPKTGTGKLLKREIRELYS
jgi:acyl-CoA synthetase (AMP-forming)/AMP-acid ligase II